jgi:tetratricopeptide (TPR) repeat protein
MVHLFRLLLLSMFFFLNSCALNTSLPTNPVDNRTIPHTAITEDDKIRRDDVKIMNDPQTLYKEKQYDKALMAMVEADPGLLEDLSARKLLWCINDRLVTAQWYLQKGIAELLNGHKDKALHHIDEVLKLYPDHKPSRLLKQNLDSINLKENQKTPKLLHPQKKISKNPTKENLRLADYYLMTGNIYFEKDQLTLAKTSWLQGLDIVPSHKTIKGKLVKLLTNEGLQLFGQGDIKASIAKWEEALKINPDDPEAKGYLDKARKAEEKVRSID